MNEIYESPEVFELGNVDELTLGCTCGSCDCCCGKVKASAGTVGIEEQLTSN